MSDRLLAALTAIVFAPALLAMARVWSSVDYYTHGFLVPLFAYAAYRPLAARCGPPLRDGRGMVLLVLALLLYAVGLGAGSIWLQGFAAVAAVAALVLRRWGPAGLRRLAFPVGFLLFAVPLPPIVLTPVIVKLQMLVSVASTQLLHGVGIAVAREGNVLVLPGGESLFVAEACSGITSLVTLIPLGVALAYFAERRATSRAAIVAAVVPLAMLANLLRVVLTVVAADARGVERVVKSPLHEMAGLLTFALACVGLLAVASLVRSHDAPARAQS